MRIGIISLLHESNTFVQQSTTMQQFRDDMYLNGEAIRHSLAASHHEIGGFFDGIQEHAGHVTAVPLLATRATPSGVITSSTFDELVGRILSSVATESGLDGILVAPHGAAVSELHRDADGYWLEQLRNLVGADIPIIGTLDLHANLSERMVRNCDALVAYRTNPHLDQRDRGREAARLMVSTLRGEISPTMAAAFPPMAINIERQCTDEMPLRLHCEMADKQLQDKRLLSNSLLLGFPYADVREVGAATIAVTDDDPSLAQKCANELASSLWQNRNDMRGHLTSVGSAMDSCASATKHRICLLDMGDNVGGGSAGDGTTIVSELILRRIGPSFASLCDPESVQACADAGVGATLSLQVGGKTDRQHGDPIEVDIDVVSLHDGRFREDRPRHGGIVEFDQGPTAVVRVTQPDANLRAMTLMFTSRRMVPFSLRQLTSCDIDPTAFRVLVAKGVNAPIAAYKDVCQQFIRVNTIGSTCADLTQLEFHHRRAPLYPFDENCRWYADGP